MGEFFLLSPGERNPIQISNSPDAVEYVPVWEDPYVEVWLYDVVELSLLLVPEEGVRHPHLAGVRQGEVLDSTCEG